MRPVEIFSRLVDKFLPFTPQETAAESFIRYHSEKTDWEELLSNLKTERRIIEDGKIILTVSEEARIQSLDLGIQSLSEKLNSAVSTGPKFRGRRSLFGKWWGFSTEVPISRIALTQPDLERAN